MTNFDHFLSDPQLVPFTEAAVAADTPQPQVALSLPVNSLM